MTTSRTFDLSTAKRIGSSELALPAMGQGCGTLGDPDTITSEEQAQQTLAAAWHGGLRYFDTAPWYGNTKSEHRVGYFLRQKPRADFVLTTKVGRVYRRPDNPDSFRDSPWMKRWRGGLPFDLKFDYSRSGILRSYEDSLARLGLNTIDALAIHDLDLKHQKTRDGVMAALSELEDGGGYSALQELKSRGEIKAIGAGINHTGMIKLFLERFEIDYFLIAMPYTLLDQSALDEDLRLCAKRNVNVVVGAVYASGILATGATRFATYGYQTAEPEVLQRVREIEALCETHDVTLKAAALQFPLAHPQVSAVIPGANSVGQVEENIRAMTTVVPPSFWTELKNQGLIRADAPIASVDEEAYDKPV